LKGEVESETFLLALQKRPETGLKSHMDKTGEKTVRSSEKHVKLIEKLCEFINENSQDKLTLSRLSKESGLSLFHLQRTFKRVTGITPKKYIEAVRLGRIRRSLRGGTSIRKSIYNAGYNTTGWLYFRPNEKLGMSPANYKMGGEGFEIRFAIRNCPLGRLLVAATERGICSVDIADSDEELVSSLQREFPRAELVREEDPNDTISLAVGKILDYLTKGKDLANSNLPLDLRSTAFQMRVWEELGKIPYGEVRSYSEIASRVGLPKATRAVANACAANPVPLVIPCHRVIRKNGDLGGYGLGVERKKILLQKEGANVSISDRRVKARKRAVS
jgi:AraC family transcriptional regulator of adaptative response/methylated-DNA-[protein]-cysteine methyltransferase